MRKLVTYAVVVATIVWSLGLAAVVPASAAYTPVAGDLIKTSTDSAVYYIDASGKRNLFVNGVTFWTWYSGTWKALKMGSKSVTLKTISQEDFDALTPGTHAAVRPGTKLIKFQNSPKVYVVSTGNVLREVSDAVAKSLFGTDYATKKVITIQNGFETDYTKGTAIASGDKLPDGSLVKYSGSEDIFYIQDGEKRMVSSDAFIANGFWASSVVTVPTSMSYTAGTSITGEEAALTTVAGTSSGPAVGGTVTVSLASDTAPTTTLLENQARASMLTFVLTNGSSADVTIDSFVVERGGLASDADFSSIAAYQDSVTGDQIGLNKTFNSDHRATFGDDFVVKAGTSKKVVITGNMPSDLSTYASDAPKLGLYSITPKTGSTVSGSLPIWGNQMGLNYSVVIATATIALGSNDPASDTAPKVGDTNVDLTEVKITNDSSTEEIQVEKIVMKQAGTAGDTDVLQYKLVKASDGTTVATAASVDKYVTFNFATPLVIGKSKNESFMVKAAEINDGSLLTLQLDVYRNTDIVIKGKNYNAYVIPTFPSPNNATPYLDQTDSQTIGNGSVKIESDATFVAANIAEGKTGVQIGQWLFTVKGEGVDISQISARIATSTTATSISIADITNGIFFDVATGKALTGAEDSGALPLPLTGVGITSTDTMSLGVGIHKIGLKVDLSSDFANNDTLQAGISGVNLTVTGDVTGNDISPTPNGETQSTLQTIKTALLTISASPSPAAQNVIRSSNVVAANILLDASASGDDLKMTQLKTELYTTTMSPDEITSLTIWDGATQLATTNDPIPTSSTASDDVTTTWSFTSPLLITKGTVKTLTIKATTAGSTSASDKFSIGAAVTATAGATVKDSSGTDASITYTGGRGQQMTIQTTGTATLSRSDEYSDGMLVGNSSGLALGKFRVTAAYGDIDIEKIYMDVTAVNGGGTDELTGLYLYDGATLVATSNLTSTNQATVLFNIATPVKVLVNTTKELTIKGDTAIIANDGTATSGTANSGFSLAIASGAITAKTSGAASTINAASLSFPSFRVVKSVPTVVIASSGATLNANGTYDLAKVTVTADAKGPVGLYKMTFAVTTSTVTASDFSVYEGNTLVATESTATAQGINKTAPGTGLVYTLLKVHFNLGGSLGGRMREISAGTSKVYTLKANVTGYTTNVSNGVSTSVLGDAADHASAYYDTANVIGTAVDGDFVWSDLSYGNTSTTATTTAQWMNGFEIDNAGGLIGTTSSAKSI